MPNTVDRRVVEMRFDNKEFQTNVQDTMTILDKLKEKLSFKGAGNDFKNSGLSDSIEDAKSRFSALEIIGTTALVNLTNSAVNFGKQMAKSFTVDQVKAGFSEYELKMGSIQTIMASTGESIDTVNGYLNKLNEYSDKTIYSFSDMTQNIGKFTNAGVKLDTAVNAIKGVSNAAAHAGSNSNQASMAMYNLSQSLSRGSMNLIDWRSIANTAGLGTQTFKQQLIDTAVAMGTLKKTEEGYITTTTNMNGKVSEAFDRNKNFEESIAHQWMTTEVLMQTLNNYSVDLKEMSDAERQAWAEKMKSIGYTEEQIEAIKKLSEEANASAQDVKTFSMLIDTVKESIGSGWAQTFELIFGNLEEAKVLWTAVNNVISDFVGRSADARNGILQIWKASNGRAALIDGFKQLYSAVSSFIAPIKEAFNDVFDPIRGEQLKALSFQFRDFAKSLIISGETAAKIKNVFTVLFSALKFGVNIIQSVAKIFTSFVKILLPVGGTALSLMDSISRALMKVAEGADFLSEKLGALASGAIGKAASALGKLFSMIGEGLSHLNLSRVGGLLAGGGIMAAAMKLYKFIGQLSDKFENLFGNKGEGDGLMDKVKGTLESLSSTLTQFQTSLKVGQLVTIAVAIGILAASCSVLADIPAKKLAAAVAAIGGLFTELGIASHLMKGANTSGIFTLSVAILVLAAAVKKLSEVENMDKGLLGVAALLGEITAFCLIFDKMKIKPKALAKTGAGLILMAVAINLLAKPVKELGAMDTASLIKGLSAIGAMLGEFAATALAFSKIKTTGIGKAGVAMVLMAAAMRILAKPLAQLGSMDLKSLSKGLSSMAVALLELATFTAVMSKIAASTGNIMKAGAALLVMSVGIKIMASALSQMGSMDGAGKSLGVLFGSMIILAGAMALMQKSLAGAAAMIVVAGALAVMAPSIALLSSLNIGGVATGLLALAGTLAIFGVGAALLAPLVPVMLALGAAMALLGVGTLALGAGMTTLAVAFSTGTEAIIGSATSLAQALPIVAKGFGEAILTMLQTIVNGAPLIAQAFIALLDMLITAGTTVIPKIVTFGLDLLMALLSGISSRIGDITVIAVNIVTNFLDALGAKAGDLANAGLQFVLNFLNGVANAIANNGTLVINAVLGLVLSIVEAFAGAIPGIGKQAKAAIEKYRQGLETGSGEAENAAKKTADNVGKNLKISDKSTGELKKSLTTVSKSITDEGKAASTAATKLADDAGKKLKIKDQTSNGANAVKGIVNGMDNQLPALRSKASQIAELVDKVIREKNKIKSPSRVLAQTGKYLMQGLIDGLDALTPEYQNRAENIATTLISSTNGAIDAMNSFSTPNFTSTIARTSDVNLRMTDLQKENDRLANGISTLTKTLSGMTDTMNSRALNNYITIDGASDPEAFADGLIRSFRLNARTV